jgi:penicillin-binding protein 2
VIETSGFGATWANPIASVLIEQYLTGQVKRPELVERLKTSSTDQDVKKY